MMLNYKTFGEGFPLVILHGLLGSLDNWLSIARHFSIHFCVYIVDLRNHGKSPHSTDFSYQIMVDDLCEFFEQHSIKKAHLLGHSMGGKVAMKFAMQHPVKVEKLVVADVAPVQYEDRHSHIFKALLAINLSETKTREAVEMQLRSHLAHEDESTIQFLMKGLYRNGENNFAWRFNVVALCDAYQMIADGVGGEPFSGKTLFIKGQQSNYINAENYSEIQQFFPNNTLEEIAGAGHWVHADAPKEFSEKVLHFLLQ